MQNKNHKTQNRNERLLAYKRKHPGISYAALGRIFKITRERVRQIFKEQAEA